MRSAQLSKATARAKACGLAVDTQTASTPTRNSSIDDTSDKSSSLSEALTNPDWRNIRRGKDADDNTLVPVSAAPGKTQFQRAGGRNAKKLSIDTSMTDGHGFRRYRDTPIDPDFIHSAPITKKEHESQSSQDSDDEGGNHDHENDRSYISDVPQSATERLEARIGEDVRKTLDNRDLRLKHMPNGDLWTFSTNPVKSIPCNTSSGIVFSPALLQTFRDGLKIQSNTGENNNQIEVPHTAALPIDNIRRDYQQGKLARTMKVIPEASAENMNMNSADHGRNDTTLPNAEETRLSQNQARYEEILSRIHQQRPFQLTHRRTEEITGALPPQWTNDSDKAGNLVKSPAHDSETGKKQVPCLNPQASEFHSSTVHDFKKPQNPYPNQPLKLQDIWPQETTFRNSPASMTNSNSSGPSQDSILGLYNLIKEVKEDMDRMKASHGTQYQSNQKLENLIKHFDEQLTAVKTTYNLLKSSTSDNPSSCDPQHQGRAPATFGQPGSGAWHGTQQYPVNPPNNHSQVSSGYSYNSQNMGPGMNGAGAGPNGSQPYRPPAAFGPQQGLQHQATNNPPAINPQAMNPQALNPQAPYSFQVPFNPQAVNPQAINPQVPYNFQVPFNPQPMMPVGHQPGAGPLSNTTNLPPSVQGQMLFGPKPVAKPQGEVRPGDPHAATQQQNYELYLEMKRASDPEYARQCRTRQLRRAERQKQNQWYGPGPDVGPKRS